MIKKLSVLVLALILGFQTTTKADEGMWVPMFLKKLNIKDMQKKGFKLSADDIYSVNHASLKDAIIIFGGGCTGEIVSPEGLIFTNHHCGYGSIQQVSTVEHDYLTNGFWSKSKAEEIPVEGLSVKFLIRMDDVTARMLEGVADTMSEDQRMAVLAENQKAIVEEATKDNHYMAIVEEFFGGNEYYLVVYEVFTDIRLVGTPPESVGKFGADTDNWMWPRHTGDFSIFRVYTAPDGSPADYAKDNVPYKSKYYLPISLKERKPGDFAFIMGNPGSTDRYLTSYGVNEAINQSNPAVVKVRTVKLNTMREFMNQDPAVRLQYASKYAQTANYWKYFQGQTKALKRLRVADEKKEIENNFADWAAANPTRKAKYGDVIDMFAEGYKDHGTYSLNNVYFREAFYLGSELIRYAASFKGLGKLLAADTVDQAKVDKKIVALQEKTKTFFKNYHKALDEKMFAETMSLYFWDIPQDQQPDLLIAKAKECNGDFSRWAQEVFSKTIFASKESVEQFLANPNAEAIQNDVAIQVWDAFIGSYYAMQPKMKPANDKISKAKRLFIAGLREKNPNKKYYPDANFTMRLTYGTVEGYSPEDAAWFKYYTTEKGLLQKEDPNNPEFVVPAKLKELILNKDFGQYANKKGELPVAFLSTNDITGGNSGSPIMDARGRLIGLAFDGNWEAMSGDIAFDKDLQRTINVDIRYVLFVIDKLGGAKNIIDELTIVK